MCSPLESVAEAEPVETAQMAIMGVRLESTTPGDTARECRASSEAPFPGFPNHAYDIVSALQIHEGSRNVLIFHELVQSFKA